MSNNIEFTNGRTLTSEKVAEMYYFGVANKRFVRNLRMAKTWENHKQIVKKNTDIYYMFVRAMGRTNNYELNIVKDGAQK